MMDHVQQPAQPVADHRQGHHKWKQGAPLQPSSPSSLFMYLFYHATTTKPPQSQHKYANSVPLHLHCLSALPTDKSIYRHFLQSNKGISNAECHLRANQ